MCGRIRERRLRRYLPRARVVSTGLPPGEKEQCMELVVLASRDATGRERVDEGKYHHQAAPYNISHTAVDHQDLE